MPLAAIPRLRTPQRAAQSRANASFNIAAPVGGLNFRDPVSAMPPTDAVVLDDFVVRPFGLELRPGVQGEAFGMLGSSAPTRTVMAFTGRTQAESRLFVVVGDRLVPHSPAGASITVPGASADGLWQWTNFQTPARNYLVAVNDGGGYWTYDATDGWVERVPTGAWPSTKRIRSVTAWKNRLWFTFVGDPRGYYLPLQSIAGAAAAFDFGPQLSRGGDLAGIASYTADAGVGIDDLQIVFGSEGDVLVYAGYDPASIATYELRGAWFIGRVPVGSRFWTRYQGDVLVLSDLGIVPISRLVAGQLDETAAGNPMSDKVAPVLLPQLARTLGQQGWALHVVPHLDALVVQTPPEGNVFVQWVRNFTTGAWSRFTGVPMTCGTMWQGDFWIGGPVASLMRAFRADALQDLTIEGNSSTPSPLIGEVQTAFMPLSEGTQRMRFLMARPSFVGPTPPGVLLKMQPDFRIDGFTADPVADVASGAVWGTALWGVAVWGGELNTYSRWFGLQGMGLYGALRMRVTGAPGTAYAGAQVLIEPGGPL